MAGATSSPPSPQPLAGRTVVVTRAAAAVGALAERLRDLGGDVVELPTIVAVDPPDGGSALQAACAEIDRYEWVVVTSPEGARRIAAAGCRAVRVAAVGPGTAAVAEEAGLHVEVVAARSIAEGLLDVFPPPSAPGERVLVAQAAGARPVLVAGLVERGFAVDSVVAYETVTPATSPPFDGADAITFTSGSTVEGFIALGGLAKLPPVVVCIGPVTAAVAASHGVAVTAVADPHTLDGLVAALVDALSVPR
jgi:uroporphyrinogen-III synthase